MRDGAFTNGALEHVAKHFASWTRRLARAVTRHKEDPATVEARTRSGSAPGKHGLTPEQVANRTARKEARRNYYQTVDLVSELKASKGQGKGKAKRSWAEMSYNERWWLTALRDGTLRKELDEAEAKCHRVQAGHFAMYERGT